MSSKNTALRLRCSPVRIDSNPHPEMAHAYRQTTDPECQSQRTKREERETSPSSAFAQEIYFKMTFHDTVEI